MVLTVFFSLNGVFCLYNTAFRLLSLQEFLQKYTDLLKFR